MVKSVATFPGRVCRKHKTTERYLDTRRCVLCQGAPTAQEPLPTPVVGMVLRGRKLRHILPREERMTPNELRTWNRQRRGSPTPTREEPPVCECCGSAPTKRALHLDHCHTTGAFRGWLCHRCNTGLGLLGDTGEALARATAYLFRAHTL